MPAAGQAVMEHGCHSASSLRDRVGNHRRRGRCRAREMLRRGRGSNHARAGSECATGTETDSGCRRVATVEAGEGRNQEPDAEVYHCCLTYS